jgi:hypothetical protein
MNALAMYSAQEALFLAHERTQELIAESNAHRNATRGRKARRSRIATALASVKAVFGSPQTSQEPTVVPRLTDYPYRS